ncbi:unnamed protein product [Cochlearia groenlandica]
MIKTLFYTFLKTKHQEEHFNSIDASNQIYPQEIEIRPITQVPWEIIKTLTIDELWTGGMFKLPLEKIQDLLVRFPPEARSRMSQSNHEVCSIKLRVKDLDTNTTHNVIMWKYPQEDYFAMRESWIQEFVKRRRLVDGMVVAMYWDCEGKMYCFSVLEGSE